VPSQRRQSAVVASALLFFFSDNSEKSNPCAVAPARERLGGNDTAPCILSIATFSSLLNSAKKRSTSSRSATSSASLIRAQSSEVLSLMAITCCWIRLQQGELGLYLAHPIGKLRGCPEHFNPPAHAPPERPEALSGGSCPRRPAGGIAGLAFGKLRHYGISHFIRIFTGREAGTCQCLGVGIFRAFRISASLAIVSSSCRMSSGPGAKSAIPGWLSGDPIQAA
jgi:hypothetical protein